MTCVRNDSGGTEFSNWLRSRKILDSRKGYRATDVDFIWYNDNIDKWFLIEEKCYMDVPKENQEKILKKLHMMAVHDFNYKGFYFIQFEKTSPENGKIFINSKEATKQELYGLLMFKSEILKKFTCLLK